MKPASGTYRYSLNGTAQAIDEPFAITAANTGFVLSGQRIVGSKILLEVEATYREQTCTDLKLAWTIEARRSFHYRHLGQKLEWQESGDTVKQESLPDGCLLFPLLRAATGVLLPQLNDTPLSVVVPSLHRPNSAGFLHPRVSKRHTTLDPTDPLHYRYYGGEYGDAGADYWVDSDGLVTRYRWDAPDGLWEVHLE